LQGTEPQRVNSETTKCDQDDRIKWTRKRDHKSWTNTKKYAF